MSEPVGRLVHHYTAATSAFVDLKRCPRWRLRRRRELEDLVDFHCRAADLERMALARGPLGGPGLRRLLELVDAGELDEAAAATIARARADA